MSLSNIVILKLYHRKWIFLSFFFPIILMSFLASYSCHHCNTVVYVCISPNNKAIARGLGEERESWEETRDFLRAMCREVDLSPPQDFSSLLCCGTGLQPLTYCPHTLLTRFDHQRNALCEPPLSSLCSLSMKEEKEGTWARSCSYCRRTRIDAGQATMLGTSPKGRAFRSCCCKWDEKEESSFRFWQGPSHPKLASIPCYTWASPFVANVSATDCTERQWG